MLEEWTPEEEARRLRERFSTVKSKAAFARENHLPGGASMLSQHLSGHRPLNLSAATAYAKGFGVTLWEISPRLANEVAAANTPTKATPALIDLENNPDYPAIRRVRFALSAGAHGYGVEYEEEPAAPIVFKRQWYERNGYRPEKLFAVRVLNGSMEPGLYDGEVAPCERG